MTAIRSLSLTATLLISLSLQNPVAHGSVVQTFTASVGDSVLDCYQISPVDERIRCYDRIAESLTASPPTMPAKDVAAIAPVTQATSGQSSITQQNTIEAEDLFGRSSKSTKELVASKYDIQTIEELKSRATKVEKVGYGAYRITLENGQIWKEKGSGSSMKIKVGQMLVIKPAAMNSFRLFVENKHRGIRVERIL